MKNRLITLFVLSFVVSPIVLPQYIIYKKDSLSMPEYRLEDVTIKPFRETQKLKELPASVSVVGFATLEKIQTNSLKDITAIVPNFYMPEYGSKLTSPVYIRGIGSRINSPSVGLYVDHSPYFEKSSYDFDLFEIDRIEVLRGPQGTLYGRNTLGGIINVFTKSPFKEQGTRIHLSGGNYGYFKANATQYLKLGRRAAFSISAGYNHRDGYFRNSYSDKSADKMDSFSGRVRSEIYITESLKAELVINYEKSDQAGYPYMIYHDTIPNPEVSYDSYSYYNRDLLSNSLILKYDLPALIINSTTSYHYFDDFQAIDQDFTPASLFFVTQDQVQNMFSQEFIVKPHFAERYSWVAGAFLFRQTLDKGVNLAYGEDGIIKYRLPGPTETLKNYDSPTSGAALFHQSTINDFIMPGMYLTAGIRLDYEKAVLEHEYFRTINGSTTLLSEFVSELDFFEVMPRLALGYSFNDKHNTYLTLSKGYKTGGFNSTFEREEDRSFMPEESWNYEAGIKSILFGNRLFGDFSLFYIDWRNQQIYQTVPSGQGSMLKNAGRSFSRGVELSLTALLPFKSEVSFSWGHTDARFVTNKVNATTDHSGNYIPYVPSSTIMGSLTKKFEFISGFINAASVSLNYNGTGKIYWDESNSTSQDYYGLLGGTIAVSIRNITVEAWGKNITNASYHAFRFSALGNSYIQAGRPFMAGFNLKIRI
jgi:iron complex outermembrane recepter protein